MDRPNTPGPDPAGSADRLPPCPSTPNCVCSDAADVQHHIAPITFGGDPQTAWEALIDHLEADPSCTIVTRRPDYLKVEARTRWLRFVDDVEFRLRSTTGEIAMRSASRVGYSDLGTNRRRLEAVRKALLHSL